MMENPQNHEVRIDIERMENKVSYEEVEAGLRITLELLKV